MTPTHRRQLIMASIDRSTDLPPSRRFIKLEEKITAQDTVATHRRLEVHRHTVVLRLTV